jgi:hypothetical protein
MFLSWKRHKYLLFQRLKGVGLGHPKIFSPPAALASSSGGGWSVIRATSFFSVPVSFTIWNIHFFMINITLFICYSQIVGRHRYLLFQRLTGVGLGHPKIFS